MKLSSFQKRKALDINMTPMIDVVFQLLIFFMTCSQVSEANREVLQLPKLQGAEDQANSEIIVNINQAGDVKVGADASTVPEVVAICLDEAARMHGNDPEQLKIAVRVDRRATCQTVNQLMEALAKAGITRVRLAVQSGE
jgi:biopolymer transport protein ExbD